MLLTALWLLLFVSLVGWLAYQRASLAKATLALGVLLAAYTLWGAGAPWWKAVLWVLFVPHVLLNVRPLRRVLISNRFLLVFRRMLPPMSRTEREALEAGTVWWDGELFSGHPDWRKLLEFTPRPLSAEERAFLEGPVEQLCAMVDDWEVGQHGDLPPAAWDFLKRHRFFGMIIPTDYGGLGFSAIAHSAVVTKIASRSVTAAVTVMVPNSLGPAELLLHYGTEEQRRHYLPRLARGGEIPCFALTGPEAGSDAAATQCVGVVGWGTFEGHEVLGMRLDWDKRYITLGRSQPSSASRSAFAIPSGFWAARKSWGSRAPWSRRASPG
jgi:acyl-CoA dehydrogenase